MNTKNKQVVITLSLILLLGISAFAALSTVPIAEAHDPPWTIPTYAYIVASPDPIGLGQTAFVVFWLDKVPPTAAGIGGDRWTGFTINITKPNGQVERKGPYISDATSAAWFLYTPDQVGTYTFDFNYPGQVASLFHPVSGIRGSNSDYVNDTFTGSTAQTQMTVQAESVISPPAYPLPTTYWTRPIEGQNTEWSRIASNWLGGLFIRDKIQPSGSAPNSAHVLWTKPYQDGGIVGGDYWSIPSAAYYTGLSYEGKFNNPLIMYGRLYYDSSFSNSATGGPFTCVDLATGETLWENNNISPTFGMLYLYESFNQHGVIGDGYLVQTSGTTWRMYDGRTGANVFNMTGIQSVGGGGFGGAYGSGATGPAGEIVNYLFNINNRWLAQWNSSAGPNTNLVATPGNTTNAFQYRPSGEENMANAIDWNVTLIATLPTGSSILRAMPDDMILFNTPTAAGGMFGFGSREFTMTAVSLKGPLRGSMLWQKVYQPPEGNLTRSLGPVDPESRVFTMVDKETMQWSGFDLDSGNQLWGPVGDFRDFQYYGQVSNPPAPGHIYNGSLLVAGYGGELLSFDARTGNLNWKYSDTYSGDQTPWGNYPLFIAGIADGKVYCYTSEHSPNVPLYKGSKVRCIDATSGNELWKLDSWYAIGSFGQSPAPIADGKIAYLNVYDMQLYCIGKGPSSLTVDAPLSGVAQGQSLVIQGKVLDQSPGAKNLISAGKFSEVPAVSDASQGEYMGYLYMQKPMPANATGVNVSIDAIAPNNEFVHVADVVSDAVGFYSFAWKPDMIGKYTIIASFSGSESYFGSADETAVVVDTAAAAPTATVAPTPTPTATPTETVAPTPSPTAAPTPPSAPFGAEFYVIIAAVVVVAVIAAIAIALRRRK